MNFPINKPHQNPSYPTRSLREYLAHKSIHPSEQCEPPLPTIQIELDVGDGRKEILCVGENTDIEAEAEAFCQRYQLQPFVKDLLSESIKNQMVRQSQQLKKKQQAEMLQQLRQLYSNTKTREVLLGLDSPKSGVFTQNQTKTYESHQMPTQSFAKKPSSSQLNKENRPMINGVSQQICQKRGKENIIQWRRQRSKERIEAIKQYKIQKQEQDMKECIFKPKINTISQRVDQQLFENTSRQDKKRQRFQQLYDNFKLLETKRTQLKQHAHAEMSFQPNINFISKKIVESKRHLGESKASLKPNGHQHCRQNNCNSQPKTGRNPRCRNTEGLPIGDYLYQQAKRRNSKPQVQPKNQIKALQHSDYLVSVLKQKKLKEIFIQLSTPPHNCISPEDIVGRLKANPYKHLMPLFQQIVKLGATLSQEDFIEAGITLIDSLAPDKRYELIFKKKNQQTQNISLQSTMTKTQLKIGQQNLYSRGLTQNREKQEWLERFRQNQARQELKYCTFRPQIRK